MRVDYAPCYHTHTQKLSLDYSVEDSVSKNTLYISDLALECPQRCIVEGSEAPTHCSRWHYLLSFVFCKFCWVLSATLTPILGLRLLLSSSSADTSPTRVTVGRTAQRLAGAASRSTPTPPTCRYPAEQRPQLVSLPGCGGPNKTPGFYFRLCVCVCLRVWRRLLSRTA